MSILNPVALQADLMRQGFMRPGKAKAYLVTATRGADGMLMHPDARRCASRKEADAVAAKWSAIYGVKFVVAKS